MQVTHIEAPFRLVYTFGDELVPTHRFGRIVVQLFDDGRMLLDNVFRGAFTKSFEGTVERATLERILGHLEEGGFPAVERHPIMPGATLRVIVIQSGTEEAHNPPIEWSAGLKMKGYGDAFRLLDSMIAELTEGKTPMVGPPASGLVRRAETPSRPAMGLDEAFDLGLAPSRVALAWLAKDEAQRSLALSAADDLRRNVERILAKYGRRVPAPPSDAVTAATWLDEVGWAADEIVSGLAAEAFALGRSAGQVRLALEEGNPARMQRALSVLNLSRQAPAREIAALALGHPTTPGLPLPLAPDARARLEALSSALRQAMVAA